MSRPVEFHDLSKHFGGVAALGFSVILILGSLPLKRRQAAIVGAVAGAVVVPVGTALLIGPGDLLLFAFLLGGLLGVLGLDWHQRRRLIRLVRLRRV